MALTKKEWKGILRAKRPGRQQAALSQHLTCKLVSGYPDYIVSTTGSVWYIKRPESPLKNSTSARGYKRVSLSFEGTRKSNSIHRLVAIAFLPNPENLPQVNHKDGNKANNDVSNLEWCSSGDNIRHAVRTGLKVAHKGEKHHMAKLDRLQAKTIYELKGIVRNADLSRYFKISRPVISAIHSGVSWDGGAVC